MRLAGTLRFFRSADEPLRDAPAEWCARWGCLAILLAASAFPAWAEEPVPIRAAVADFHNIDTSGESSERTIAHASRVQAFGTMLRDILDAEDRFEVVELACPGSTCSPDTMGPAEFIQAARNSGARLIVYGSIRKMSTLVQIGVVQALDLDTDNLVLNQHLTFRGDSDEAFRRAADFVGGYLKNAAQGREKAGPAAAIR